MLSQRLSQRLGAHQKTAENGAEQDGLQPEQDHLPPFQRTVECDQQNRADTEVYRPGDEGGVEGSEKRKQQVGKKKGGDKGPDVVERQQVGQHLPQGSVLPKDARQQGQPRAPTRPPITRMKRIIQ